ncbi:peptidyl-prolyl cis-trans isomerase [Amaricoccus solimangrovi]|nr:peptidylprolyl isomerase [Amaricoccus solimangrovi]
MAERAPLGWMRHILRDPLTHFLVAGGVLFAAWTAFSPQAAPPPDPVRIEITEDDLRRMALVWLSQGRPLPSPDQMRELAQQEATQRILVREAVSLGLDQEDEIIARRLAQKMDFLLADLATFDEPSEDELRAWYVENADRFALPPRVSFRHLYFSLDAHGPEGARIAASQALPTLAAVAPDDPRLPGMADRFMFRDYYGGRTPDEIAKEFGPAFSDELLAQPQGRWAGPIRSGYGWHLVWIDTLEPGRPADFETIREDVRSAWLDERYREIRARAYDEMLLRYTIVIPDPATVDLAPAATMGRSAQALGR